MEISPVAIRRTTAAVALSAKEYVYIYIYIYIYIYMYGPAAVRRRRLIVSI